MGDNGLGIWFREGIVNILLAANEASASTALVAAETGADPKKMRIFREGYKAALVTVAVAFGIAPQAVNLPTVKPIGEPGRLRAPDKST